MTDKKKISQWYRKWNYLYKPKEDFFFYIIENIEETTKEFNDLLEEARAMAYYSTSSNSSSRSFDRLACIIYYAKVNHIATPYDHVLNSRKDFEYKLNHLHKKE